MIWMSWSKIPLKDFQGSNWGSMWRNQAKWVSSHTNNSFLYSCITFFFVFCNATFSRKPDENRLVSFTDTSSWRFFQNNRKQRKFFLLIGYIKDSGHLILQDKTLFCACVDNFKQNGGFWRHCACVDNFKQNGVFWRQHLPVVRVWTWPKYNKHHHDLKNQLCRFIDMYIGKIFWPTAPCRGCPEKEIWGQG